MFKGITITDAIKTKAVEILTKAMTDNRAVDRTAPDAADKRKAITDKRNADLAALLSNTADKKMLADNIAAMPAVAAAVRPLLAKLKRQQEQTADGRNAVRRFAFLRSSVFVLVFRLPSSVFGLLHRSYRLYLDLISVVQRPDRHHRARRFVIAHHLGVRGVHPAPELHLRDVDRHLDRP